MKILIIFIAFSSCNNSNPIDESTVFRYNEHKNINSLDPIFAKDIANIQLDSKHLHFSLKMNNLYKESMLSKKQALSVGNS